MAVLEILKYPHPALKKRCERVEQIDSETKQLVHDMTDTMYAASGIGLAASQVGVLRRVIVVDVSPVDPRHKLITLVNPEIVGAEGEVEHEEGCLSVPECFEKIKRKERVRVRGLTAEGVPVEFDADGILAIALQHEVDHLNGTLILDRLSSLKRELYRKRLRKHKD